MDLDSVTAKRLRTAFPSSAATDVDAALRVIDVGEHKPTDRDVGPVVVSGEALHIPHRIYSPEPTAKTLDGLTGPTRTALECLFTRHHNGRVREKYVRTLLSSPLAWVPPFVIQLLGEYVIEIHHLIHHNIGRLGGESYRRFVAENPAFVELTRKRIASYWDCYFRTPGAELRDHVGVQVMDVLARCA